VSVKIQSGRDAVGVVPAVSDSRQVNRTVQRIPKWQQQAADLAF
jgi:hypothetical protein